MKNRNLFRSIIFDQDGFHFEGSENTRVRWKSIRRISTYKLDLLTTDEIRFAFQHDESSLVLEVSEEQPGFEQFSQYLEQRFSFPLDWQEAVLTPALARNEVVLFTRAE